MKLLLLNAVVILIVGCPLLALHVARDHSKWVDDHHGGLSFILWIALLTAVYIWLLPWLGLQPNWRVLAP